MWFQEVFYLFLWKRGDRYNSSKLFHQHMVQPVKVLVPGNSQIWDTHNNQNHNHQHKVQPVKVLVPGNSHIWETDHNSTVCLPSWNLDVTVAGSNLKV